MKIFMVYTEIEGSVMDEPLKRYIGLLVGQKPTPEPRPSVHPRSASILIAHALSPLLCHLPERRQIFLADRCFRNRINEIVLLGLFNGRQALI